MHYRDVQMIPSLAVGGKSLQWFPLPATGNQVPPRPYNLLLNWNMHVRCIIGRMCIFLVVGGPLINLTFLLLCLGLADCAECEV